MTQLLDGFSFENPVAFKQHIASGADGEVYRLNENLVGKFSRPFSWIHSNSLKAKKELLDAATKEFETARDLYSAGISVPRPLGVFSLDVADYGGIIHGNMPVFVMDYVHGIRLGDCYEEYSRARELRDKELDKARDLGFIPGDSISGGNSIYCSSQDRTFLIDFARWRRK